MALTVGTQLGSLEITGLLGKGGMGEVYRARDMRLKREVAIKILPEAFSDDADRVSRFQREAEVLASLNHPHIAGIHELGEADGARFLVLELVEGETLSERIERGAIPVDEALQLARSMCEALEAAHEKGVIHRDLKPANVKVTPEGKLKVLDFGLAKAMENAPGGGTLFAVPFDLGRLQVTGGQVPVVEGVRRSTGGAGIAQFSFSNTGSLIYIPGPVSVSGGAQITLATLGRQGGPERLKLPLKPYAFPRVSPDGKRVAVSTDDGKDSNVWIYELAGATAPRQLTLGGANRYPVWSANGERVAFQSDREGDLGIFWQKADGTGTAERLTPKPEQGTAHIPDSWSRDGKALGYTAVKGSEASVWIYSLQDKKASVFAEKPGAFIGRAAFSPDGQWLAYQSTETGTNQIFVQPFPGTGAKYPVARGGHPFWSPDGREIIYNPTAAQVAFVGIATRPTFSFGEPTTMQLSGLRSRNPATDPRVWDVMPDGKKILGTADSSADPASSGTSGAPQIQVVLNWFEDLKQRMSAK